MLEKVLVTSSAFLTFLLSLLDIFNSLCIELEMSVFSLLTSLFAVFAELDVSVL